MVSKTYFPSGLYGVGEKNSKCCVGIRHPEAKPKDLKRFFASAQNDMDISRLGILAQQEILCKARDDKKAAFTLAEVLITLGIIGIVAAMTIPTLVSNYQKKVLHTKFQKAYAVISEVNTRMIAEGINQYNMYIDTPVDEDGYRSEEARKKQLDTFASYLSGARVCNDNYIKCFGSSDPIYQSAKSYKTLDGAYGAHIDADAYTKKTIITSDGMSIWGGGLRYGSHRYYVDTNGYRQGPNKLGYDLFRFDVNKNGTVSPEKDNGNINRCSFIEAAHGPTYLGFGCGYYAWKNINPDAPDDASQTYWDDFLK